MTPSTLNATSVLLSVAGIWTLAVVTPGPNFFLTVQTAIGRSRPAALWNVLGIACGTVVWGLGAFFGLTMIFQAAPWLYGTLKLAGGSYLVYLGFKLIHKSFDASANHDLRGSSPDMAVTAWCAGLLTNLSNPKTAAFVTSLFAASMPTAAPTWLGLTSVALMAALSVTWYAAVACFFSIERFERLYQQRQHWADRSAGLIFIAFGARLAMDR